MYNDFWLGVIVGSSGIMLLCVAVYLTLIGIEALRERKRRRFYESLKASALECDNG